MWLNLALSTGENLLASALVVVLALWMDKWLGGTHAISSTRGSWPSCSGH
ncbi:hypothetical protein P4S72_00825 [Vibrio sp. PP-XX7]